jgi:hypothetical protein
MAGAVSTVIAALMWRPEPIKSAIDGLLAIGVAPIGLLLALSLANRDHDVIRARLPIARSWTWIAAGAVVFTVFLLTQSQGLGPLAKIGLRG